MTNNATMQDDTELQFAAVAGELWQIDLLLSMEYNNTTGGIKWELFTAGTWVAATSNWQGIYYAAAQALTVQNGVAATAATAVFAAAGTGLAANGGSANIKLGARFRIVVRVDGTGIIKARFANNVAAAGRTSTMHKGSMLLAKRM